MKIQLLIATADNDYSEFLSNTLSTGYPDTFSVGICSSQIKLKDLIATKKFDIVLGESEWINSIIGEKIKLLLAFWIEQSSSEELPSDIQRIKKYQRISSLVSDVLEHYASVASGMGAPGESKGKIIAFWSPAGGVGKTSVALAYATRKVSFGESVTYLSLEHFSGTGAFFPGNGKSISALFEKLAINADLLVQSIRQNDSGSGISYFLPPNNYDDINELSADDITTLTEICVSDCDFLVIDLPNTCDKQTQAVFEAADIIFLVTDGSSITEAKINIFCSQHCVFNDNKNKIRLVVNKAGNVTNPDFETFIKLPKVNSGDPISIYKSLSGNSGLDQ